MVNKREGYVKGRVHVNGMEIFWSLLKRGLKGIYVSVDPAHLQAYVDEQVFRFNSREDLDGQPLTDSERFDMAVRRLKPVVFRISLPLLPVAPVIRIILDVLSFPWRALSLARLRNNAGNRSSK